MSIERERVAEKARQSAPDKDSETAHLLSPSNISLEVTELLRKSVEPALSQKTKGSESTSIPDRNDRESAQSESVLAKLRESREEAQFATPGSAAEKRYVKLLQDSPGSARQNDVVLLCQMAGRVPENRQADASHLSDIGRTLLQIAGKGTSTDIKQSAARAFQEHSLPGTEDPAFRKALAEFALSLKSDAAHANGIIRYGFRLDGEQPYDVPSRWDNALAQAEKPVQKEVTDVAPESSRRDATVRAIEKVMPSYGNIMGTKRTTFGTKDVSGASVAIDDRGYFLTAHHVVNGVETIKITTNDGKTFKARVVQTVPERDLAVLKIEKTVPEMKLGPAARKDLLLGEKVIAIGNPFGYEKSVSAGILASKARIIQLPNGGPELKDVIQVNLGINPGNSGGPLINRNGELIGIVSAMRDDAQCMAFVVNADDAQRELASVMKAEKMAKITHGITGRQVITREDGPNRQYVKAERIAENSPAAQAGLKNGDAISAINGKTVMNQFDIERAFWDHKAGDKIKLTVLRDGKPVELELRPKAIPVAESRTK